LLALHENRSQLQLPEKEASRSLDVAFMHRNVLRRHKGLLIMAKEAAQKHLLRLETDEKTASAIIDFMEHKPSTDKIKLLGLGASAGLNAVRRCVVSKATLVSTARPAAPNVTAPPLAARPKREPKSLPLPPAKSAAESGDGSSSDDDSEYEADDGDDAASTSDSDGPLRSSVKTRSEVDRQSDEKAALKDLQARRKSETAKEVPADGKPGKKQGTC